ncbi:MAG: PPOX class F420-dependent oxidoreductase [SAR202 cluster bacterium Io17-Chloro-G9]|nr:MAG: PPOX class F420-dependent oxidoreductase [SAR202 cluster bacterium Io17-Chloro-G9]
MLASARIGHLATADETGAPHVIPVCFALGGDLVSGDTIYSVLDQKPKRTALTRLRRVRNILANPQVALVVDHYEESWDRLWYILVRGRAELLEDGDERVTAIGLLRQKYDQYRTMDIGDNPVIKIAISQTVAWGLDSLADQHVG